MTPSIRVAAARTLLAVDSGRATLAAELERARREFADERDRALLFELTAGTLRWRGALDGLLAACLTRPLAEVHETVLTVLRIGAYEMRYLTRIPPHAIVNEAVEAAKALRQSRASGLVNAVLRTMQRKGASLTLPARPSGDNRVEWVKYLSTTLSHPQWLAERYLDRAGAEGAEAWCLHNNATPAVSVRVVPGAKADATDRALVAAGAEKSPRVPGAWRLPAGVQAALPVAVADYLAIQDEGSQLIAHFAGAVQGEKILDLCAAPGGKTAILGRLLGQGNHGAGKGLLVSCDTRRARLDVLSDSIDREGLPRRIVHLDATRPLPFRDVFDRVLLDAPCSGLGTISRDPDVKWTRGLDALPRFAAAQITMLHEAAAAVRPGGRLIYATCSSEPEENEHVVQAFLDAHPAFERLGPDLATRPDIDRLDAFYAAVLHKKSDR